ncbi:MAG: hypothetical protein Q8Q20_00500 [bacterium]|nr:hypothetical protein [bacterium]
MRRLTLVFGFTASLLLGPVLLTGCGDDATSPEQNATISGRVLDQDNPVSSEIMVVYSEDREEYVQTDAEGFFQIDGTLLPKLIVAATEGKTGFVEVFSDQSVYEITLDEIPTSPGQQSLGAMGWYWFGVYDTNGDGDVRFRYRYNFSHFYCSSWLPGYWPFPDPNPNHWDSWDLNDFPPPWKGKMLLVPRRHQWWHQAVYGFSISRALFLISH